jgi:dCMP deaminase
LTERLSLDQRGLALAHAAATWSRDPSTKVGAVILRPDKSICSTGYNGFPRTMKDDETWLRDRDQRLLRTIHAEANAILTAKESIYAYTIYVTAPVCLECAKLIAAASLGRVVMDHNSSTPEFKERWRDQILKAKAVLEDSQVRITYL